MKSTTIACSAAARALAARQAPASASSDQQVQHARSRQQRAGAKRGAAVRSRGRWSQRKAVARAPSPADQQFLVPCPPSVVRVAVCRPWSAAAPRKFSAGCRAPAGRVVGGVADRRHFRDALAHRLLDAVLQRDVDHAATVAAAAEAQLHHAVVVDALERDAALVRGEHRIDLGIEQVLHALDQRGVGARARSPLIFGARMVSWPPVALRRVVDLRAVEPGRAVGIDEQGEAFAVQRPLVAEQVVGSQNSRRASALAACPACTADMRMPTASPPWVWSSRRKYVQRRFGDVRSWALFYSPRPRRPAPTERRHDRFRRPRRAATAARCAGPEHRLDADAVAARPGRPARLGAVGGRRGHRQAPSASRTTTARWRS